MKNTKLVFLLMFVFVPKMGDCMELNIPEGKQEVEQAEEAIVVTDIKQATDLLSFLDTLPVEIKSQILEYFLADTTIEKVYNNIFSLFMVNKEMFELFNYQSFVKALIDFLYNKFIPPVYTLLHDENELNNAFYAAISLVTRNKQYGWQRLRDWVAQIGNEAKKQKLFKYAMLRAIKENNFKKVNIIMEFADYYLDQGPAFLQDPVISISGIVKYGINHGNVKIIEILVKHGALIESKHLLAAVNKNKTDIAKYLMDYNVPINADDGGTLLKVAMEKNNEDIIKYLFKQRPDAIKEIVKTSNNKEQVPLLHAKEQVPLLHAIEKGNINIVKGLVKHGALIDVQYGITPAFGTKIIKLNAPLILAIEQDDEDIVKYLVDNGADVNMLHKETIFYTGAWDTPLISAITKENMNIITYLVEHGADVNLTNTINYILSPPAVTQRHGDTPLMYAIRTGNKDVITYLLDKGADINGRNKNGDTPLLYHILYAANNIDIFKLLIERGADVNLTNYEESSNYALAAIFPLMAIARQIERGYNKSNAALQDMLDYLLKNTNVNVNNVHVNKIHNDRITPLIYASWYSKEMVVKKLLEHKSIDINLTNKDGNTARDMAQKQKNRTKDKDEKIELDNIIKMLDKAKKDQARSEQYKESEEIEEVKRPHLGSVIAPLEILKIASLTGALQVIDNQVHRA